MSGMMKAWRDLRTWWQEQAYRYTGYEDGHVVIDQNDRTKAQLDLRQKVGLLLQGLDPGYGACMRCLFPWWAVDGHSTPYDSGGGCFPLCEKCWKELGHSTYRMKYYKQLWDEWESYGRNDLPWEQLEAAVKVEDSQSGFMIIPDVG